jgi:hypothetical protein
MLMNPTCRCILIGPIVDDSSESNSAAYEKVGIKENDQWSFLQKHQYISYKKETFENLVYEFEKFCKNATPKLNPPELESLKGSLVR